MVSPATFIVFNRHFYGASIVCHPWFAQADACIYLHTEPNTPGCKAKHDIAMLHVIVYKLAPFQRKPRLKSVLLIHIWFCDTYILVIRRYRGTILFKSSYELWDTGNIKMYIHKLFLSVTKTLSYVKQIIWQQTLKAVSPFTRHLKFRLML